LGTTNTNGNGQSTSWTFTPTTPLSEGVHSITAQEGQSKSDAFSLQIDTTAPTSAITFPAAGGSYNASGWTGTITGTADGTGSGISNVQVTIQRNLSGTITYWDGSN
jgi:hypothetical protein